MSNAITPYVGTTEARVHQWADMTPDQRRRAGAKAANEHDQDTLCSLLEAHVRLTSASGRTSSNTLRVYRRGVSAWLAFADRRGVNVLHPDPDHGATFRLELMEQGLSPATVRVYLAGVRALYRALRWSRATAAAPLADVRPPADKVAPWDKRQPYEPDQVAALLEHADPRDRVMVLLGAHGGLRVSEAAALRWSDVDFAGETLTVQGKGGKVRRVPMSGTLRASLEALFIASTNPKTQPTLGGIAAPAIRARMRRLAARAGVAYQGFHSLRHHAGTEMTRAGLTDRDVARVLGHASTKTTAVYAKWSNNATRLVLASW